MGKDSDPVRKVGPQEGDRKKLEPLRASSVALLTTFRRDGRGVGTPVGIRLGSGKVYFMTRESTGKVKRMAKSPRVSLSPCTSSGEVIGPTVEGVARRLEGQEAELALRYASLRGRGWMLLYKVLAPGDRWIPYEISPPAEDGDPDPGATKPHGPYRSAPS
jgi:PPOX class probable F420-dependent enzyme